jgi:putative hemolysin
MADIAPQLALVFALILINAAFSGSEMALISLRDAQLQRLEEAGGSGRVLADLARDPNRFLATIQIGITLAGFLASAAAAVALAEPLVDPLSFLGGAAEAVAILLVTAVLTFVTLVFGELAPKRIAMQRAERWGLFAARPLAAVARVARPFVWLLSRTSDVVVRFAGVDPAQRGDEVSEEELRTMVAGQSTMSEDQRTIISGAFELADRVLRDVLVPRRDVTWVEADTPASDALEVVMASGRSRVLVARGDLDDVLGVVALRDLVGATGVAADHTRDAIVHPETKHVIDALKELQVSHQQLAVVVDEYGGVAGIVTLEDLLEELVGEIWDETDEDIRQVEHRPDGSIVLPGTFPAHDLDDIGVDVPPGQSATVAGVVLEHLGRIPDEPGDAVEVGGWRFEVLEVTGRAITSVHLVRVI